MLYLQLLTRLEKWTSVFTVHPGSGKRRKELVYDLIQSSPWEKSIPQGALKENNFIQVF